MSLTEFRLSPTDNDPVPSYPDLLRLDDKTVLVVGGGLGIGRQMSHALASVGATVVCVDIIEERAAAVAKEVGGIAKVGDATNREDIERIVDETVAETGRLDGLADIVGIAQWSPLLDITDDIYTHQFDNCFRHAFLAMQAVGNAMKNLGTTGSMAFVASVSGMTGAPNHAIYGAAKAGLISLVRTGGLELAQYGIRVNAVSPGNTATPRARGGTPLEQPPQPADHIPLGRVGRPSDIARALLFFLSDLSDQITGQTLVVDGGVNVKFGYQSALRTSGLTGQAT
ncbi:MAG: SDR family oxidoreductase [Ilumatobacteraceae bacterium]